MTAVLEVEQRQEQSTDAWRVFAVAAAGVFVVFLDATVVNIAFPALQAEFTGVTRAGLSWVLNAYAAVFGALFVMAGRPAEDAARRQAFCWAPVLFRRSPGCCGVAQNGPGPRGGG